MKGVVVVKPILHHRVSSQRKHVQYAIYLDFPRHVLLIYIFSNTSGVSKGVRNFDGSYYKNISKGEKLEEER